MSGPMPLGQLRATHPRLNLGRIAILRALYEGGEALLCNDKILSTVLPRHAYEGDDSYKERKATAFYEPVFQQVINHIVSGLAQDPCAFDDGAKDGEAKLDEYWKQLMKDATPPDDDRPAKTFDQQVRAMCAEALVTGFGWTLCDMPPPPAVPAASEAEQRQRGDLNAYPVPYRSDCVIDWEMHCGTFLWVRSYSCERPAIDPTKPRKFTVHTWIVWERDTWTRYQLELDSEGKDQSGHVWRDEDIVAADKPQPHSFGRVPWVLFDANPGDESTVHIGDIIESQCRALFNEENGEAFLRRRAHYQQLYEFLGPEMPGVDTPISENQQDSSRAGKGRRRGPDIVEVRGSDDDAKFVAPDMSAVAMSQKAIDVLRDAILRVVGQMALSNDHKGAMLRRSGDSKKQDKIAEEIVLGEIGKRLLGCARQVAKLLSLGRKDTPGSEPHVIGYQRFDVDDTEQVVDQAAIVENITIPSARFQIEHKLRLALALLGDDVDQDVRAQIRADLEAAITQDQLTMGTAAPGGAVPGAMPGQQPAGAPPKLGPDGKPMPPPGKSGDPPPIPVAPSGKVAAADGTAKPNTETDAVDEVLAQLDGDFPPESLAWIKQAEWEGPIRVSLDQIDYANSGSWRAASEPDKVAHFADKIGDGWEKPIILVKRPGVAKLMVVDGHHRALAYAHHEKSALAYVGTVDAVNGPWDEMHAQQKGGQPGERAAAA